MQVHLNNSNNINFGGTLKIYNVGRHNTKISEQSSKLIENAFSFATKDAEGHMDLILFDRYNMQSAQPDTIYFKGKNYSDSVEAYLVNTKDNNLLISKLISIFYGFKEIEKTKENIKILFK